MNKEAWNFWVWQALEEKLYQEAVNPSDIIENGAEEFYEFVHRINEEHVLQEYEIENEEHRYCIKAQKGNKKYLVPTVFESAMPFNVTEATQCLLKKSDKKMWNLVTGVNTLNITPDNFGESFKSFVDNWNCLKHTEPKHWTFMKLISIASTYKGVKLCICTEPSFGKNANFTILKFIIQTVGRLGQPTLAKFETSIYYNKVNVIDEVTSLEPSKLRDLETAILLIGDNSPEYGKHSMAQKKAMNKVDLSGSSLIFPYNRIQDIKSGKNFFDDVWGNIGAFRSRFPQILLKGKIDDHLPQLNKAQAKKVMETNFEDLRKVAKQLIYWREQLHLNMHGYDRDFIRLPKRHMTNLEGVIDVLDAYSDTEEEFKEWIQFMLGTMHDYQRMLDGHKDEEPQESAQQKYNITQEKL